MLQETPTSLKPIHLRIGLLVGMVFLVLVLVFAGVLYKRKPVLLKTQNNYSISLANSWAIAPHTIPEPKKLSTVPQVGGVEPTFYSGGKDLFYNTNAISQVEAQKTYAATFSPDSAPVDFDGNVITISPLLRVTPGISSADAESYFADLVKSNDPQGLPTTTKKLAQADLFAVQKPLYLQGFVVTHHQGSALFFTAFASNDTERSKMVDYLLTLTD